jgi:hypothetical protein
MNAKLEALDEEEAITKDASVHYAETTKAVGTVFLLLDPDGRVRSEYRVPRAHRGTSRNGNGVDGQADGGFETPKPPTSDDLKDAHLATTFTHHVFGVREALLKDTARRSAWR